ncbi:hypothetical protein DL89DRAFT_46327 [Linderina pennispora]|uniref:Uncharacterized protein n=1 Tax=Linderina pennispora TaxID=61395 RepID=A0A1Y1W2N7_9FUNG|nr:uncharacterized protein DL89DRAFT_46327 [Linderina pennispora]ORX67536.1 hypothetical protein DL89DRAFT_46327 [Linderina pennispora]
MTTNSIFTMHLEKRLARHFMTPIQPNVHCVSLYSNRSSIIWRRLYSRTACPELTSGMGQRLDRRAHCKIQSSCMLPPAGMSDESVVTELDTTMTETVREVGNGKSDEPSSIVLSEIVDESTTVTVTETPTESSPTDPSATDEDTAICH